MNSKKPYTIKNTEKAKNIQVQVDGRLTVDEMEDVLVSVSSDLDLVVSHITTLSRKNILATDIGTLKKTSSQRVA